MIIDLAEKVKKINENDENKTIPKMLDEEFVDFFNNFKKYEFLITTTDKDGIEDTVLTSNGYKYIDKFLSYILATSTNHNILKDAERLRLSCYIDAMEPRQYQLASDFKDWYETTMKKYNEEAKNESE